MKEKVDELQDGESYRANPLDSSMTSITPNCTISFLDLLITMCNIQK